MSIKEILQNADTKIIDVRTRQEYDSGHIAGAINIPLDTIPANTDKIRDLNSSSIVFYCRSGNRSGQAVGYLKQLGFTNIYNGGGLEDMQYLLN